MLKFITLPLSLFLSLFVCYAQGVNTELGFNAGHQQTATAVTTIDEFTFMVVQANYPESPSTTSTLLKIDTTGETLTEHIIQPMVADYITVDEMIPSEAGGVYVSGHLVPICDIVDTCYSYVQKHNAEGVVDWTILFNSSCYEQQFAGLTQTEDGNLYINDSEIGATTSDIYMIHPDGTVIDTINTSITEINGFAQSETELVHAFHDNQLFELDETGAVTNTTSFSANVQDVIAKNDTLFVLTIDSLFALNSALETINETTVTDYSAYSHLKVTEENVQFLSTDYASGSAGQHIISLPHDFSTSIISSIPFSTENQKQIDFSTSHLSLGITYPLTLYNAVRYIDFSLEDDENAFINNSDASITDIEITGLNITPDGLSVSVKSKVELTNLGGNTIESCKINHDIGPSLICGRVFYQQYFTELNLLPGESVWLDLDWIGPRWFDSISETEEATLNFCVFSSHPNYLTDLNVSNDNICEEITGVLILETIEEENYRLYPNPTENVIQLDQIPDTYTAYVLYETTGKIIYSGDIENQQIDLSNLATGLYLIELKGTGVNTIRETIAKK